MSEEQAEKTPRNLKVFIWRKRSRGFLVVLATNVDEAREAAITKDPNLERWVQNTKPDSQAPAKAGTAFLIKQRG